MKRKNHLMFYLTLLICAIMPLGFASFDILAGETSQAKPTLDDDTITKVCYNDTTNKQYTTIEMALKEANSGETVYVFPSNNQNSVNEVEINYNCEIKEGVTLNLPYSSIDNSDGTFTFEWNLREGTSTYANRFADYSEIDVTYNRKLLVTIKEGVTLTVKGTLQIGGILGSKTQGLQGHTSSYYAELLLETGTLSGNGAKIIAMENSLIECQGYIKETSFAENDKYQSKLTLQSGSILKLPFVVYDYQGGSATGGIFTGGYTAGITDINTTITMDGYVCPFNLFDCPNIQVLVECNYKAEIYGYMSLYTSEQNIIIAQIEASWNTIETILIGENDGILKLKSGMVSFKYKGKNAKYTVPDPLEAQTEIKVYGQVEHGRLQIQLNAQIVKINIDTSKIFFPVSYRFNIKIMNNAKMTLRYPIKFLNDSYLTINENGTLLIEDTAKVIFYNSTWKDVKTTVSYKSTYKETSSITTIGVNDATSTVNSIAYLYNNGTITVNTEYFSAHIFSTTNNSKLELKKNCVYVESDECKGSGSRQNISYVFSVSNVVNIKEQLRANVYSLLNYTSSYIPSGTYYSKISNNGDVTFGINLANASINGPENISPNTKTMYSLSYDEYSLVNNVIWSTDNPNVVVESNQLNCNLLISESVNFNLYCTLYFDNDVIKICEKNIVVADYNLDIAFDVDTYNMSIGDYRTVTPVISNDEGIEYNITWSSTNGTVASVDQNGLINALNTGTSTIYATLNPGGKTASLTINVDSNIRLSNFSVSKDSITIDSGDSATGSETISITIEPSNAKPNFEISTTNSNITTSLIERSTGIFELTINCAEITRDGYSGRVDVVSNNGVNGTTLQKSIDVNAKQCIVEGTLITMYDGSYKNVEDIKAGDIVKVFNHETGKVENSEVIFNDFEELSFYNVIELIFDNGNIVEVVGEHGFFDVELNKYVYIDQYNFDEYIGHKFVTFDGDNNKQVIYLESASVLKKQVRVYSPITYKTFNYFTNDILSLPGGITGLVNIFEYDVQNLKYDTNKKNLDIEKYGLLSYEDFNGLIDRYVYEAFNGKYLSVSLGKGLLNWNDIRYYISRYSKYF